MQLPAKYAGQHVQCPDCRAMLRIPTSEEDLDLTRWYCKCGLRLKARPRAAGRKVRCPRCSSELSVPLLEGHPTFMEPDQRTISTKHGECNLMPSCTMGHQSLNITPTVIRLPMFIILKTR